MTDEIIDRGATDGTELIDGVDPDDRAGAGAADRPPIELTEAALEALLFVAERPLSRREIGTLAGIDRATVDERLGDLEVSLRDRGLRLLIDGDRVELATAPEAGALVARYVGADAVRKQSVPFLGARLTVATGPASLALSTGAPDRPSSTTRRRCSRVLTV